MIAAEVFRFVQILQIGVGFVQSFTHKIFSLLVAYIKYPQRLIAHTQ